MSDIVERLDEHDPVDIEAKAEIERLRQWQEPFLPANLEDSAEDGKLTPQEWTAQALEELARQLTLANDFYYPLIGAAGMLRKGHP